MPLQLSGTKRWKFPAVVDYQRLDIVNREFLAAGRPLQYVPNVLRCFSRSYHGISRF